MAQINFGKNYFTTRERIAQVVKGITDLAKITYTDLPPHLTSDALHNELNTPFLFAVYGEVNAGKSSLINGLFGYDLCKVNILPETNCVTWYRHGTISHETNDSPSLKEYYRPVEFLRNFSLVDTPGTNTANEDQQAVMEHFIPLADLILFVFPITNPWGAATWNLISHLSPEDLSRTAFIIQQADQRDPADISIIIEHMSDLSIKRIGIVPPIFAVSGKKALQAKQTGSFSRKTYRESGFPPLEDFISRHICDSQERRAGLYTWRDNASSALRQIEDSIEDQTRNLNHQNDFLESLEGEINSMREHLVARLPQHLISVTEVFQTEAIWVTKTMHKTLGYFRSLVRIFIGDSTGSQTESLFINRLRTAVESVAESDGQDIVTACYDHWQQLGERVKEAMGTEIGQSEPVTEKLDQAKKRFIQRIGRAAHQAIGNLHVRRDLERELRRRNLALKSFTATTLLLLCLGASLGIIGFSILPLIVCSIAVLFFVGGGLIAITTRIRITDEFQKSLLNTCGDFADTLRSDYEDALRIFFQDYTTCLNSIRKHLAEEKLAIEPKLKRWHELFLTLKSIEQDL